MRLALIGWGAIGQTVAHLLSQSPVADRIEWVAVGVSDPVQPREGLPAGVQVIFDPSQLEALQPTLVAEAAGRDSVIPWGRASLSLGAEFIVSSASAFADAAALEELTDLAVEKETQMEIQPGALAGVEALSAARLLGLESVEHRIVKPPRAWRDTPAERLCDLNALTAPVTFSSATASATAQAFPKNANVAMTTALAGVGADATIIQLVADPDADENRHEITAHGAFGSLNVAIANRPLPGNPNTSALAALSLARTIEKRLLPLVV